MLFGARSRLQIPIFRIKERYRAAQGRNDYTYLAHDLAARPAGKFQFAELIENQTVFPTGETV